MGKGGEKISAPNKRLIRPAALILAGALAAACTGIPGGGKGPPETAAGTAPRPPETPSPALRVEDGLETAAFDGLPPEARSYLKTLAEAFGGQKRPFLLAQGEAQFEKEVKPHYDEETYLALLYRIGPLSAEEGGPGSNTLPRLSPRDIVGIEYGSWEEEGPLLEIRARLISASAPPVPCRIMLIWRLRDPKIQGLYP
jgi:hypothetical protein